MGNDTSEITKKIKTYIISNGQLNIEEHAVLLDENIFEEGYVDSFGIVDMIFFIETEFSITMDDSYFFDERFSTIEGLSNIVSEIQKS